MIDMIETYIKHRWYKDDWEMNRDIATYIHENYMDT